MTTNVRMEVPKTATWKVRVVTQTKKWDTETKAYGDWADDLAALEYLPGVTGHVSLWDGKRISLIEEVPLTDEEKAQLLTGGDGQQ